MQVSLAIAEVTAAMDALRERVAGEITRRDLVASGDMLRSLDVDVVSDPDGTTGTLSALDYWVNVGSGTPPGSDVTERDIAKWLDDKGFEGDNAGIAWFIARKIRRDGSKDYRVGNPNAFETAIEQWENSTVITQLGERTANEYGAAWVEVLRQNMNN